MKIDIAKNTVKVAKVLARMYKANPSADNGCINIVNQFENSYNTDVKDYCLTFSYRDDRSGKMVDIPFGNIDIYSETFGNITGNIAREIVKILKMPSTKHEVIFDSEERYTQGSWYSSHRYTMYHSVTIVPLCKEFMKINKRLAELGMPMIEAKKWTFGTMFGKRSSVYDRYPHYYASRSDMCDKVLAYLKGKKKLTKVELVDDVDDSDRERGIRYETEWEGSWKTHLRFTGADGKQTTIW